MNHIRSSPSLAARAIRCLLTLVLLIALPLLARAQEAGRARPPSRPRRESQRSGTHLAPVATGVADFAALARLDALRPSPASPADARLLENNEGMEDDREPEGSVVGDSTSLRATPLRALLSVRPLPPFASSPAATQSFVGLDDIPMVGTGSIVIPPDVSGAVGLTKVMQACNNNYRILDKTTGAVLSTVSTTSFWSSVMTGEGLTDPRMAYDPYNNRWIIAAQTVTTSAGKILIGISQTSDPQGAWYLYNFNTGATVDFPILGFNKNWVSVSINQYDSGLTAFRNGLNLVLNYPLARTGTANTTLFALNTTTGFCVAPCVTYSATAETLFAVAHLGSGTAAYALDYISGTASAPVYHQGASRTRPGGGWLEANGSVMPQSPPNSGASACSPPCGAEAQDCFVRSAPVYRNGQVWYAQTVELITDGNFRTAAQWTRLNAPSGDYVDGGRLQDPTATATNGGKWYGDVSIAVNAASDFLLAFTQFSSAQHPSAGYAVHLAGDAPGSIRDAQLYKAGEDYYHKTFSATVTRNRWGDFSSAQVDPADDGALWALQEYAKARIGTDDGVTGSNSSRWGTYWGKVVTAGLVGSYSTITATASTGGTLTPVGAVAVNTHDTQAFTMTPDLYHHVSDVRVDGVSIGAVAGYTFFDVTANHTLAVDFAPDTYDISASAGANGSISPAGVTSAAYGSNLTYTMTPAPHYDVASVLVDGVSVGAVTSYTFTFVGSTHTIAVTFAIDTFKITAGGAFNGAIAPAGATTVSYGGSQAYTITPATDYHIGTVKVDNVAIGAVTQYTFSNVAANHTISATFVINQYSILASAGSGGSITPAGTVTITAGTDQSFDITPDADHRIADVLVDSVSVGAVNHWDFFSVARNHTIAATFADSTAPAVAVTAPNGGEVLQAGSHASLTWTASDAGGIGLIDLWLSRGGAAGPFDSLALRLPNSGTYDWTVTGPATSSAYLKVVAHDVAGNTASDLSDAAFSVVVASAADDGPVTAFALSPVRPNPAQGAATLTFALPRAARIHLGVIDVQGRELLALADGEFAAGRHLARIRAGVGLPPGLYFVRMVTPDRTLVERFAVIK